MCDAMPSGTKCTAVCAMALSMPVPCMMPVNTPAASRMRCHHQRRLRVGVDPHALHVDVRVVDQQRDAGADHEHDGADLLAHRDHRAEHRDRQRSG